MKTPATQRLTLSICILILLGGLSLSSSGIFAADTPAVNVRIHNGLVSNPAGIAFVIEDQQAFVLDIGRIRGSSVQFLSKQWKGSRPGIASPDDSIHDIEWDSPEANIHWTWGRVGDAAVGRLQVDKPVSLAISVLKETWPGFANTLVTDTDGAVGETRLADQREVNWHLKLSQPSVSHDDHSWVVAVDPARPVYLVAGLGTLPAIPQVDNILDSSAQAYQARRPAASGDWGDFVGAIADNLNNSRVYSTDNHLLAHTVSRDWAKDANNAPYFCWDSFFNGALASLDDPQTAKETIRGILGFQTAEGLVPNVAHEDRGANLGRITADRSQPPVGALCVWKINQRWPDKAFLAEVYPKLKKWHAWWFTARDGQHDGMLEWGCGPLGLAQLEARHTSTRKAALYETGWDDNLEYDGAQIVGNTLNAYAVDLNSLWSMDAEYLSLIAKTLGQDQDALMFAQQHDEMNRKINDLLWNEEQGMYCSRMWGTDGKPGAFLTRYTPMNFYPLICGAPDAARAARVLKMLTNPAKFWGQWKLPTLAYDDPKWPMQAYWRGNVWAPVNYLVFQGLKRYATPEECNEFAKSSVDLFMRNWTTDGFCGENYQSTDGHQGNRNSDRHYTWGALLCLIGVENIVDQTHDGQITTANGLQGDITLRNIPLGGKLYEVRVHQGQTVATEQK